MRLIGFRCTEQRSAASVWTAHSFFHRAQWRRNHGADDSYFQVLILILCEFFLCVCFFNCQIILQHRSVHQESHHGIWQELDHPNLSSTLYGFICCSFIPYQEWKTDHHLNLLLLKTWCISTIPVNRCLMISFIWLIRFCYILAVETQYLHIRNINTPKQVKYLICYS